MKYMPCLRVLSLVRVSVCWAVAASSGKGAEACTYSGMLSFTDILVYLKPVCDPYQRQNDTLKPGTSLCPFQLAYLIQFVLV
eukprot:203807-Pelagomonas_calceolata.AAC.1